MTVSLNDIQPAHPKIPISPVALVEAYKDMEEEGMLIAEASTTDYVKAKVEKVKLPPTPESLASSDKVLKVGELSFIDVNDICTAGRSREAGDSQEDAELLQSILSKGLIQTLTVFR